MTPDIELLTQYANQRDEATFAELVRRHLDHVYSAALRLVNGDTQLAEDVSQLVFADLARRAGTLTDCQALSSWLHTSARFAAAKLVRTEQRRRQREQAALAMPSTTPHAEPDWERVRPILDETIAELNAADRDALLLRYFEKKPFAEVGSALGLSENSARMRVDRATDKLRTRLAARGITSTMLALASALARQIVTPAPSSLGARVVTQALAGAGAAAGLKLATKLGLAALVVAVLVTIGILVQPKYPVVTKKTATSAAGGGVDATPAQGASNQSLPAITGAARKSAKHPGLELYLLDKQTGQPIADQTIGLRGWVMEPAAWVWKKVEVKAGRCVSPFDPYNLIVYEVSTHIEGYADVRLQWSTEHGDVIPVSYTVNLVPPVLLHGAVVDPQGNPLPDALVTLGSEDWDVSKDGVEDHRVDQLTVTTDAQGHWEINRFAEDALSHLDLNASHPQYTRSGLFLSQQPDALKQLRDGTFVFRLGVAGEVTGRVVDTNGEPVASALVLSGVVNEIDSRSARTDANGMFDVSGCMPGAGLVTASMDGYAPAVATVKIGSHSEPIELTLSAGKTLRLRLVDGKGKPVKKAFVAYSTDVQGSPATLPQVDFTRDSDAEGRVVWEHAPYQPLPFQISARGFLEQHEQSIRPDDLEHDLVLSPSLFIQGTVRDADTDELLPRVRLSIGTVIPGAHMGHGLTLPDQTLWDSNERFNPIFSGGQFRKSLDEYVINGATNAEFIFRFAAEGYQRQTTRSYQIDEGLQELNIHLRKANDVRITVYRPDGSIAAGAQAGLMGPDAELQAGTSGFSSRFGAPDPSWLRTADEQGQFLLPEDDSVRAVVIVHPDGFASVAPGELRKTGVAHLDAWATVRGVLLKNGQPLVNEELGLTGNYGSNSPIRLDGRAFRAVTDSDGKFEFAKAPPGPLRILRFQSVATKIKIGNGAISIGRPIADLELKSGETRELSLDADASPLAPRANK